MKNKPKLSFLQIWNLSFGFLGVQIGYSLQNSNTSSILQVFGADLSSLSYFWLMAPIAGLIVQPIIGMFSDSTWSKKLGRRRPYILLGALISTIALLLMPNCNKLMAFAPLVMGALIFLFMDLSFNITMQPFRALVTDMLDDSQKTEGFVVQTFLINLGSIIGALLPLFMTWIGVSDTAAPGEVSRHIAYSYYAGAAILLSTVLVTIFTVKEYPPKEFAEYNGASEDEAAAPAEKKSFLQLLKTTPKTMIELGVVQFFSWASLFLMWNYLKPLITRSFIAGDAVNVGAAQTWTGVLNAVYPVSACIVSLLMTRLSRKLGNKPVYAATLLCGAIGFIWLSFAQNQYWQMIPMLFIGIAWAGILAMPYSILSRAIDARASGAYMGIFNFTVVIPQICMGLLGGAMVSLIRNAAFGKASYAMLDGAAKAAADSRIAAGIFIIAGIFMLLACVCVYFVKEKSSEIK
jgi:maltose/moltooligosaccharide transporter